MKSTTPTAIGIGAPSASLAAGQGSTMSPPTGTSGVEQSLSAGRHQRNNPMEWESQSVSSTELLSISAPNDNSGNTLAEGNLALVITGPTETVDIAASRGLEVLGYSPMVSTSSNPADSKTRRGLPNSDPNKTFEPRAFSDIPPNQYTPYDRAVYDADLRVQYAHM